MFYLLKLSSWCPSPLMSKLHCAVPSAVAMDICHGPPCLPTPVTAVLPQLWRQLMHVQKMTWDGVTATISTCWVSSSHNNVYKEDYMTPRSSTQDNRRFGGTYCLHFQDEKAAGSACFLTWPEDSVTTSGFVCHLLSRWFFLLGLFLDPEDGGDMFLRNFDSLLTEYMSLYPRR
jgi:hypothetical protein